MADDCVLLWGSGGATRGSGLLDLYSVPFSGVKDFWTLVCFASRVQDSAIDIYQRTIISTAAVIVALVAIATTTTTTTIITITMYISTSPPSPISTSPAAPPPSPANSLLDLFPRRPSLCAGSPVCAFPSWPNRSSLAHSPHDEPSAYISDDDLFPSVFEPIDRSHPDLAYSQARHATGRDGRAVLPEPTPLPPLYAPQGQDLSQRKRRRSSRKQRGGAKAMTPIVEGPE